MEFPYGPADFDAAYKATGLSVAGDMFADWDLGRTKVVCACPMFALACYQRGCPPEQQSTGDLIDILGLTPAQFAGFMNGFDGVAMQGVARGVGGPEAFKVGRQERYRLLERP